MLPEFELYIPSTLREACAYKAGGAKALAGGTDIFVAMHNGSERPAALVDLKGLEELKTFETRGGLIIGALTVHEALAYHPEVRGRYQAIFDGCSQVGSSQIRHRGTVGGNVCNAAPSADSISPLLVHDAVCVISGPRGERRTPLSEFFTGPKRTVLEGDELLKELRLEEPGILSGSAYYKYTRRNAMDLALFGVAVYMELTDEGRIWKARVAMTTAAPTPMRACGTEALLEGGLPGEKLFREAGLLAAEEISPRSSWRSSAEFRVALAKSLTPRTLTRAFERAAASGKAGDSGKAGNSGKTGAPEKAGVSERTDAPEKADAPEKTDASKKGGELRR
jgi:CO/xanthine dehydrogenase FAD-binding subunit